MVKDSTKKVVWAIAIVVAVLFAIIISVFVFGIKKIGTVLMVMSTILFVLAIFGAVVYLVYWIFFRKQKFDATYMNAKSLRTAGRYSKPDNIRDLYLSGDKGHSRVRIGSIIGYCRIQVMKKITEIDGSGNPIIETDPDNKNKKWEKFKLEKEEQDVFVVQRSGFPMSLFSEDIIVRVSPDDHDQLIGDVTLSGFSVIPISEYYFLNNDYLDVRKIDFTILKEAERGIFFESLKDTKEIIDKAIGLDSGHKKEIESKALYELPKIAGSDSSK